MERIREKEDAEGEEHLGCYHDDARREEELLEQTCGRVADLSDENAMMLKQIIVMMIT